MLFCKKKNNEKDSINTEIKARIVTIIDTVNDFNGADTDEKIDRMAEMIQELKDLYHSNYREYEAACLACGVDEEDFSYQLQAVENYVNSAKSNIAHM